MTARRAQVAGAIAALVAFAVVVEQVMTGGRLVVLDRHLADHYTHHLLGRARNLSLALGNGRVVALARLVTPLGEATLLIVAMVALAFLLYRQGRRRESAFVVVAAIGGIALDIAARLFIGYVRPDLPFPYSVLGRYGLPSGHALDSTTCYGAALVVVWVGLSRVQRVLITLGYIALVAAISWSRVVLLAHYLSDILAGAALGTAWLLLVMVAFSLPRHDRLPSAP